MTRVILLLQEYYQRRRGTLPTVDQLETWLRAGAEPINDGDDESDNVQNTRLNFLRVNAQGDLLRTLLTVGQRVSQRVLVLHQREERRAYLAYARTLRRQYRRASRLERAAIERQLRADLQALRAHWRVEQRWRMIS